MANTAEAYKMEIVIKAAKASVKQSRAMYVYAVAYRGLIITAMRPPAGQAHFECTDGHVYSVTNLGAREHVAKIAGAR